MSLFISSESALSSVTISPLTISPISPFTFSPVIDSPFISPISPISSISPVIQLSPFSPFSPLSPVTPVIPHVPIVTSLNMTYPKPTLAFYQDIDKDPEIHKFLSEKYYYKTLEKWLYDDLINFLNYFYVKDGVVSIINSMDELKSTVDKDSEENIHKKIEFIKKYVFKKKDMYNILKKYVEETGSAWVNLHKNQYFIIQVVENYLKKKIKKHIGKVKK